MRCQEVLSELDAFLTGEIENGTTSEIAHHLEECAACRAELEMIRKENALYREYASAMTASGSAEDKISSPIRRPQSAPGWRRWAAAAAVLIAALLSWRVYVHRHNGDADGDAAGVQTVEMRIPVAQAVNSYEQALSLLQSSYEGKKMSLDPALIRDLDRNLQVTEAAVAECKLVLEKHPNDPRAIEFLFLGYEKQVGILKQITEAL